MTSMPAAHFGLWDRGLLRGRLRGRRRRLRLRRASTRSRRSDDPHPYARGVEHVLVNGTVVVDERRAHGARDPGRHLPAAMIDLRSDLCSVPTDAMWDAMRSAELGWPHVRRGRLRQPALRARRRAAREGRRDVGADVRDGEPRRDAHVLRAGRARRARGRIARPHVRVDGDRRDRAARAVAPLGGGRTTRSGGRRGARRAPPRRTADPREHAHPRRRDGRLGRS